MPNVVVLDSDRIPCTIAQAKKKRINLLSPLQRRSCLKEDEFYTQLLVVHHSFPGSFSRELRIIEKKKKRTPEHFRNSVFGVRVANIYEKKGRDA